jgi:hypothetical protein
VVDRNNCVGCVAAFGQRIARHPASPIAATFPTHLVFILWSFPMSRIFKSIVGLVIISSAIGIAAAPAHAESKPAQCQRFKQAIGAFNQQIYQAHANRSQNSIANIDRMLKVTENGLKQLQKKQFGDPKIRGFQQSALDIHVKLHNDLASIGDAVERGDQSSAKSIYVEMLTTIHSAHEVDKQVVSYCGRYK